VLQGNPRHAQTLHLLGVIALRTGNFSGALAYLGDACEAGPLQADFRNNLALAHRALGQLPQAEAALREALRLRPEPEIQNNLGTVLLEMGRPAEGKSADALAYYQSACLLIDQLARTNSTVTQYQVDLANSRSAAYRVQRSLWA